MADPGEVCGEYTADSSLCGAVLGGQGEKQPDGGAAERVYFWSRGVPELGRRILTVYSRKNGELKDIIGGIFGYAPGGDEYGALIRALTERVRGWQYRGLESVYPFLYMCSLTLNLDLGFGARLCRVFSFVSVNSEGRKDCLGLWLDSGRADQWDAIFAGLKKRGCQRVGFIVSEDAPGLREAAGKYFAGESCRAGTAVFGYAGLLAAESCSCVARPRRSSFCADLRKIYGAADRRKSLIYADKLKRKWGGETEALRIWNRGWEDLSGIFDYPSGVRRMLFAYNAVKSLRSELSRGTRYARTYTNETTVLIAYMRAMHLVSGWVMPYIGWREVSSGLELMRESDKQTGIQGGASGLSDRTAP